MSSAERTPRSTTPRLLRSADHAATLLFAVEGAAAAGNADQDLFGVLVIAFVTAIGGGLVRDLILGEHPPAAFASPVYLALAGAGSITVVTVYGAGGSLPSAVIDVADAAGLALFCVTGSAKALNYRLNGPAAIALGVLTGCGGGAIRDVLLNQVPVVLHAHVYAVAAMVGAAVVVLLPRLGGSRQLAMAAGFVGCLVIRLLAISLDWNLPHIRS